MDATAVATAVGVDPQRGLASRDAQARAVTSGPNELAVASPPSVWRIALRSATQPFVLLLLAAGLGAGFLGEVRDGVLILIGLIPLVVADVLTEYRGEEALRALREASAPSARVRRDAEVARIAASDLVPGDVVLLRVGDIVPADLRLTRADSLVLNRSILTGEAIPEAGVVRPDEQSTPLADRRSVAYSGTSVVGGRGEGVVIAIGAATEVGRIGAGLSSQERRRSPLQHELDRLVRILLVVAIALIVITVGAGAIRGNSLGANLIAGITAAIAAIPEEPPILLAVVLGLGAYRLLRRDVLVRRLNAEEILGAVALIVTDKTGTLTQNRLEVASVTDASGPVVDGPRRTAILADAIRAEDDAWQEGRDIETSSFTGALMNAVEAAGGTSRPVSGDLVAAQPVDERRPYSTTTARRNGGFETLMLGAPEAVLGLATEIASSEHKRWLAMVEALTASGERVVGLARVEEPGRARMIGLIGFADALRLGVVEAAAAAHDAGIQVVVVTGDHPITARSIARAAGLGVDGVAVGSDIAAMSDDDLARRLPGLTVVARSTPDQKERIVRVARRAGRIVAVTGDGVNDAPALHAADVAVAMGSGTAVAKQASDLVLGDDSFATLVFGIGEGRRIVDNVQKGLVFLISTHVALLGFILIATLGGFSQPLLPIQVLWLELFIDLAASVAFEREPAEPDVMRRPPRPAARPLLTSSLLSRIALAGGFSAFAAMWLLVGDGGTAEHGRWLAYTTLVCAQAVRAYANRTLLLPLDRLGPNMFLLAACVLTVVVQVAIPFIPPLASAFTATPLEPPEWGLVVGISLAPAIVAECVRRLGRGPWVA